MSLGDKSLKNFLVSFLSSVFFGIVSACVQYQPINMYPNTTDFVLSPTRPTSEDSILIDWLCPPTDPNRWDHLDLEIQWFHNGCEVFVEDDDRFPAWRTKRDDTIDLHIRAWDGQVGSLLLQQGVVISNASPRLDVSFYPREPKSGEEIYVDWWIYDADGDELDVTWNWIYNDVIVPIEKQEFPANITQRGDQVGIRLQAFDGLDTIREDFYVDIE
jgi:hypothetical protein